MKGLFSPDAPLTQILSTLFDLMILNIVFVVCCLPVVTIGAASVALQQQTFSVVKGKGASVSGFFLAFRENGKKATMVWLAFLLVSGIVYMDTRLLQINQTSWSGFAAALLWSLYVICTAELLYVFALMAKFENTLKNHIVCAFFFIFSHLPATVLLLMLNAAPIVVFLLYPPTFLSLLPLWTTIAFSLISLVSAWMLTRCFKNYLPPDPKT